MELFDELESQLYVDSPANQSIQLQYKGRRLSLKDLQFGEDFVLGSVEDNQVAIRNSRIEFVTGSVPTKFDLNFSQFLESVTWPRRISFDYFGASNIALGYQDGFIRFQDRNLVFWKPDEAIDLLLIWGVENQKR